MKKYNADGRQRQRETGHTPEYFKDQLIRQNHLCAICEIQLENNKDKRFIHADHNHTTKKPRGILCRDCNIGIGMFRDKVDVIKKAIKYLEAWN